VGYSNIHISKEGVQIMTLVTGLIIVGIVAGFIGLVTIKDVMSQA
jgi:hypothetical protein